MIFEEFPTEIIYQIFDYLSGDQVIQSFFSLNSRFDHLIKCVQLKTLDLSQWKYRDLTDFIKRTLPIVSKSTVSFTLGNRIDPMSRRLHVNAEFLLSLLIEQKDLKIFWTNLEQIVFIRPIVEENVLLNENFLQTFFIESFREKLVLKKRLVGKRIEKVFVGNSQILRKFCGDFGGIFDEIFVDYENVVLPTIISRVKHLKIFIDHFAEQWPSISKLIGPNLDELTLIIVDQQFEEFRADALASILPNFRDDSRLNLFLQVSPRNFLLNIDVETLTNEFSSNFYTQHQCHVTVVQSRQTLMGFRPSLLIYTSPLCISNLILTENHQIISADVDFSNLTRLTLNPSFPFHPFLNAMTTRANERFPQLNSLEFLPPSTRYFPPGNISLNHFFSQIRSQIGHLHLNQFSIFIESFLDLFNDRLYPNLKRLEISDDSTIFSILNSLQTRTNFTRNIQHLIFNDSSRVLRDNEIRILRNFSQLKTLKFTVKLGAKYTEQLDTIAENLLLNMKTHLNYLHVVFHQDNLLIMPMEPSESQLSEWLGHNQRRFQHVLAIELNRREFFVWM